MVTLQQIKEWFRTGMRPTQQQFWDTFDSFWHKGEQLPSGLMDETPIVKINEGVKTGLRLKDSSPLNYGNIGGKAIDLSNSDVSSQENGATGDYSFATGINTMAKGKGSFVEGFNNEAIGNYSHAEGGSRLPAGSGSEDGESGESGEGKVSSTTSYVANKAGGEGSHAEGVDTRTGNFEGAKPNDFYKSKGFAAHSEGYSTFAEGDYSHSEGKGTMAIGDGSHSEGSYSIATGKNAHAEGLGCKAEGDNSHAEGTECVASGNNSHAGGFRCKAIGGTSFAHGESSEAVGSNSFALGNKSKVFASNSVAINGAIVKRDNCSARGCYRLYHYDGFMEQAQVNEFAATNRCRPYSKNMYHYIHPEKINEMIIANVNFILNESELNSHVITGSIVVTVKNNQTIVSKKLDVVYSHNNSTVDDLIMVSVGENTNSFGLKYVVIQTKKYADFIIDIREFRTNLRGGTW